MFQSEKREKEIARLARKLHFNKIVSRTKRTIIPLVGRDSPKSADYNLYFPRSDYISRMLSHKHSVYNTDRKPDEKEQVHLEAILPKLYAEANKKQGRTEILDNMDSNLFGLFYEENILVQLGVNNYDKQLYNIRRRCTSTGFSIREMFKKARKIR